MSDGRKKPGWMFWTAVVVLAIVLGYPLSIGPVAWISDNWLPASMTEPVQAIYLPLAWLGDNNDTFRDAIIWYLYLFLSPSSSW